MSKAYKGGVVSIRSTGLTREYYRMFGGGCRRMMLEYRRGRWYVDEWPYELDVRERCRKKHPHKGVAGVRRRRRRISPRFFRKPRHG